MRCVSAGSGYSSCGSTSADQTRVACFEPAKQRVCAPDGERRMACGGELVGGGCLQVPARGLGIAASANIITKQGKLWGSRMGVTEPSVFAVGTGGAEATQR